MELSWQAMHPRLQAPALVLSFALGLACSSEPLAGEPGGSGGTGGADYTSSPCYGQKRATLIYDFSTHMTREAMATCRAEGERTLVYVTDELWQNPFTQSEVNAFMAGYEVRGRPTSFDPELGVLPLDELVFGSLDGPLNEGRLTNGKLPLFVVSSGGAGDGYLCSWCEGVELHLDGPLLRSLHTDKAFSIAAHETVHAIHRGYDANEEVWVDESLAQAAMTVNGFFTDQVWLESFLVDTNVAWGPGVEDPRAFNYGAGLLLGTYLWEQGGPELLTTIVKEQRDGWPGIDLALSRSAHPRNALELFGDMAVALFLDDPASGYAFDAFDLGGAVVPATVATGTSYEDTLEPYGIVYVVPDDAAAGLTLDAPATVAGKVVLTGNPADVRELSPGERVSAVGLRVVVLTATESADFTLTVD